MTTTERDESKILERIALLLRKAESTTPQEAEALTEHAQRLMLRYGIEQARVQAAKVGRDVRPEEIVTRTLRFDGVYARAFVELGGAVAFAYGTVRPLQRVWDSTAELIVVGFESDAVAVETLTTSLVLQARVALDRWWTGFKASGEARYLRPHERTKVRRDYLIGFGTGAAQRLRATRSQVVRDEQATTPGTDVMLLDRRAAVDAHVNATTRRTARGVSVGDGHHYGVRDGRNANVGGTSLDARRVALTGRGDAA